MTTTTRKPSSRKTTESREQVRQSIREFAKEMAPAPAAPKVFEIDAKTAALWDAIRAL